MCTASTKLYMYYKRDVFYFDIVNFPFLHNDVSRRCSNGVDISKGIYALLEHIHILLTLNSLRHS